MTSGQKLGLVLGIVVGLLSLVIPLGVVAWMMWPSSPKDPLPARFDTQGPYLILATRRCAMDYSQAIGKAAALHPAARQEEFDPDELSATLEMLRRTQPRYVLVFIEPDEMDVNFAWRWLTMATQVDDDPFVDMRTGFITGATPLAATAFVDRIADVASGQVQLVGAFVDNLGPPEQGNQQYFNSFSRNMMIPVFEQRFSLRTVAHGKGGFTDKRLAALDGAGIVHFGGHGHPDRIDDGLLAQQVERLKLAPCIVFNGACYTGVTRRWFDVMASPPAEKFVDPADSFCLKMLANNAVAYLAAVHPDHGMPVYQELEFLAYTGAPLGDLMKHTHDGVVLGGGGKLPQLESLGDAAKSAPVTPTDVMLKGTAARILFGDPALIVGSSFTEQPFATTVTVEADQLRVAATVRNGKLMSEFTDTFHSDLSPNAPFNDRAVIVCDLPAGWTDLAEVTVEQVTAKGSSLKHRLVGFAIEQDQGKTRLHVQVDVPATGFQQSAFRAVGSTVSLVAKLGIKHP